jgi:hypothetical protein
VAVEAGRRLELELQLTLPRCTSLAGLWGLAGLLVQVVQQLGEL